MKQEDTWPSYHGWGGSYELDTLKLLDSLACHDGSGCPEKMFDLAIDLGADSLACHDGSGCPSLAQAPMA